MKNEKNPLPQTQPLFQFLQQRLMVVMLQLRERPHQPAVTEMPSPAIGIAELFLSSVQFLPSLLHLVLQFRLRQITLNLRFIHSLRRLQCTGSDSRAEFIAHRAHLAPHLIQLFKALVQSNQDKYGYHKVRKVQHI